MQTSYQFADKLTYFIQVLFEVAPSQYSTVSTEAD